MIGIAFYLQHNGKMTLGVFLYILQYVSVISFYIRDAAENTMAIVNNFGVMQNALDTICEPIKINDSEDAIKLKIKKGGIRFSGVNFGYGGK